MSAQAKNIVFDWNCTLLDDFHAVHDSTNRLLELDGHTPMTAERFRDHYTIPLVQFYRNAGFVDAQVERLLNFESTEFHDYYEPLAATTRLRDGAAEILGHARQNNVNTLILSNHIVDLIRAQLQRLGIAHLFTDVLAYADRAVQFRDMTKGERLRRFIKERRLTPGATMIVGDTVEEIEIAREQGLISVAITGGCVSERRLRDENPHHVIHSLHELKAIMRERGFAS